MDDMEMLFSSFDEEEAELLLKDIDVPSDPELSSSIKARLGIEERKIINLPLKRLLPLAAAFLLALALAAGVGIGQRLIPVAQPSSAQTTTQLPPEDNPLMVAISTGNDDIIQKLISVPGVITKETLDFALNLSSSLSYNTIHQLALKVRDTLGSTGLDSLVEGALMGDSQKVITELDTRREITMTPFERLAFFFSVAFCDSETVKKFVDMGYDINITDASGDSIYAIAEKYGNEDTKNYAISMGITS